MNRRTFLKQVAAAGLEGAAATEMDKNIAYLRANGVPGVFSVTNNLKTDAEVREPLEKS